MNYVLIGIIAIAAIIVLWWFCSDSTVPKTQWSDWHNIAPKPVPIPQRPVDNAVTVSATSDTATASATSDSITALVAEPAEHLPLEPPDGWIPSYFTAKTSRGEAITCQTLANIYGKPFTSVWPQWLINPETGKRMQLDCYNHELRIAAEYQGEQHYVYPNAYHTSVEQFHKQRQRDLYKRQICDQLGIYLITVNHNVPYGAIPSYVSSHTPEQQLLRQNS